MLIGEGEERVFDRHQKPRKQRPTTPTEKMSIYKALKLDDIRSIEKGVRYEKDK
ncbi:hypothetical protein ACNRWW_02095 [Metabacillus sp. HB246100]